MTDRSILDSDLPFTSHGVGQPLQYAYTYPPVPEEVVDGFATTYGVAPWTPVTGRSNQHGYDGPVFHPSEYLGDGLLAWVKANPATYVTVHVTDPDDEEELVGWVLLRYVQNPTPVDRGDTCSPHVWSDAQTVLDTDYGKVDYDTDDGTTVCTVKVVRSPLTNEHILEVTPWGSDDVSIRVRRN